MSERKFVTALMTTISKAYPESFIWRPNDAKTLGIPDIVGFIRGQSVPVSFEPATVAMVSALGIAIEAKKVQPLLKDPFDPGRRKQELLKHAFTGPQVSNLRAMC